MASKNMILRRRWHACVLAGLMLTACGGRGGGASSPDASSHGAGSNSAGSNPAAAASAPAGPGARSAPAGTENSLSFSFPIGFAVDAAGTLYVADYGNDEIRAISPAGAVKTLAGSGSQGDADGTGSAASFNRPEGIALDSAGNVYVADYGNNEIRRITPAGVVTTLAGSSVQGDADGTGGAASFSSPAGVAVDSAGVYVTDYGNNEIRRITPAGVVTTLAGSGAQGDTDGTGGDALFNGPEGIARDSAGNLYVADNGNNKIRKITPAGVVTTLAGSGAQGDTDGAAKAASFNGPEGVAVDLAGNVYVADYGNNAIRKITPGGMVTTLAGSGVEGAADGSGRTASFNGPAGVAVDAQGNLYVGDEFNNEIRKITPSGVVTTLVGLHASKP